MIFGGSSALWPSLSYFIVCDAACLTLLGVIRGGYIFINEDVNFLLNVLLNFLVHTKKSLIDHSGPCYGQKSTEE